MFAKAKMDRLLEKHPDAIDFYCTFFLNERTNEFLH